MATGIPLIKATNLLLAATRIPTSHDFLQLGGKSALTINVSYLIPILSALVSLFFFSLCLTILKILQNNQIWIELRHPQHSSLLKVHRALWPGVCVNLRSTMTKLSLYFTSFSSSILISHHSNSLGKGRGSFLIWSKGISASIGPDSTISSSMKCQYTMTLCVLQPFSYQCWERVECSRTCGLRHPFYR